VVHNNDVRNPVLTINDTARGGVVPS
jgi:hypothetical protein